MISESVKTLARIIRPERSKASLLMAVILLSIFFESFGFAMIIPLMEILIDSNSESTIGSFFSMIFEFIGIKMTIVNTSIVFLAIITIKNILKVFREYLRSNLSYSIKVSAQKNIYLSYINMPFRRYIKYKHGALVNRIITETQNCAMGILQATELISGVILVFSFIVLMLVGNFELTISVSLAGCLLYICAHKFFGAYSTSVGNQEVKLNQEVTAQISEDLSAMKQIRILGIGQALHNKLSVNLQRLKRVLVKWDTISASTSPVSEQLLVCCVLGYIIFSSTYNGQDQFKEALPSISMIIIVAYRTLTQTTRILVNKMAVNRYLPSIKIVEKLINQDLIVEEKSINNVFNVNASNSDIIFDNVSFFYDENKIVLRNLSLNIQQGKVSVFMGPSGSGKSTIINLLLGMYSPNSGTVNIGNVNIQNIDIKAWRNQIGYVSQDVFLFHTSIEDNIRIGDPTKSREEVISVAVLAGIHDFIIGLKNGYNTVVGDRGVALSGGQRQRISIARALIKKPSVLILDEASSALDKRTAQEVNENIFHIMKGRTVIVISHKESVLEYADNVFHLSNGELKN